jgi:hypothetical protein
MYKGRHNSSTLESADTPKMDVWWFHSHMMPALSSESPSWGWVPVTQTASAAMRLCNELARTLHYSTELPSIAEYHQLGIENGQHIPVERRLCYHAFRNSHALCSSRRKRELFKEFHRHTPTHKPVRPPGTWLCTTQH